MGHETEVVEGLFVGDLQDAQRFEGVIVNVLPDIMEAEPAHAIHVPFMARGIASMIEAADVIADALSRGARVLVHCEEGCERAPLVVAWFLVTRRAMTMDSAYALLQSRRPFVQDRRRWLGEHSR
jgi:protein-tyrosine phosphatase